MGWDCEGRNYEGNGIDERTEHYLDAYAMKGKAEGYEVLRICLRPSESDEKGRVAYMVVQTKDERWAAVFSFAENDKKELFVKQEDETVGPLERRCPKAVLDMLTPTKSRYALDWRKDCCEYEEQKKKGFIDYGMKMRGAYATKSRDENGKPVSVYYVRSKGSCNYAIYHATNKGFREIIQSREWDKEPKYEVQKRLDRWAQKYGLERVKEKGIER